MEPFADVYIKSTILANVNFHGIYWDCFSKFISSLSSKKIKRVHVSHTHKHKDTLRGGRGSWPRDLARVPRRRRVPPPTPRPFAGSAGTVTLVGCKNHSDPHWSSTIPHHLPLPRAPPRPFGTEKTQPLTTSPSSHADACRRTQRRWSSTGHGAFLEIWRWVAPAAPFSSPV